MPLAAASVVERGAEGRKTSRVACITKITPIPELALAGGAVVDEPGAGLIAPLAEKCAAAISGVDVLGGQVDFQLVPKRLLACTEGLVTLVAWAADIKGGTRRANGGDEQYAAIPCDGTLLPALLCE